MTTQIEAIAIPEFITNPKKGERTDVVLSNSEGYSHFRFLAELNQRSEMVLILYFDKKKINGSFSKVNMKYFEDEGLQNFTYELTYVDGQKLDIKYISFPGENMGVFHKHGGQSGENVGFDFSVDSEGVIQISNIDQSRQGEYDEILISAFSDIQAAFTEGFSIVEKTQASESKRT